MELVDVVVSVIIIDVVNVVVGVTAAVTNL